MKLTPKLLAHLRACYHDGVLESEPASLSALLDFAAEMLPLRDALLTLLATRAKLTEERAKVATRTPRRPGWFDGINKAGREDDAAYKAFRQLARELAETDNDKGADDV